MGNEQFRKEVASILAGLSAVRFNTCVGCSSSSNRPIRNGKKGDKDVVPIFQLA